MAVAVEFDDGDRRGRRRLRPWSNRDEEEVNVVHVLFWGRRQQGGFCKNYLHRRGVLEGLIAKVMSTLGCEMEAQDLRCAYVHRSHLVHMIYYL
jgi:hypothetical protein